MEVWKLHAYGCINLEAKCPETSSRRCIVPIEGKVQLPIEKEVYQCTCCGFPLNPEHITAVYANNCSYGYKGLHGKKEEVKSGNGLVENEILEIHGLTLAKWKQVAVASVVNEDSYRECKLCKERWADRQDNGKLMIGHYFCVTCVPKVLKRIKEKEDAEKTNDSNHFNYLTDWTAPTGSIKTKGGDTVDISEVSLSNKEKDDAEKARMARLEQLRREKNSGVDVANKFSSIPAPFQKPKKGDPNYVSSDEEYDEDYEEDGEMGTVNGEPGMKRGGGGPGGGGMKRGGKRGGPMHRGGPKKEPYQRGQNINTGGGGGYKSLADMDEEARKRQPVVTMKDIANTELKAAPQKPRNVAKPEPEPEFAGLQLKATPRNDTPKQSSSESSQGISIQLRATPKTNRLSAKIVREEPTFFSVQLKPTPRNNNNNEDGQ